MDIVTDSRTFFLPYAVQHTFNFAVNAYCGFM